MRFSVNSLTSLVGRLVFVGLWAVGGAAAARDLTVGFGRAFASPSAALAAASAGDRILISPGEYFDCAVVSADRLRIEGVGDADRIVLTDKTCQGKALLVIDGRDVTVANLTLTRARVPDGNGAGIRAEGGNLTVDGVHFVNNQNGILSADKPAMVLTVRGSTFIRNGACQEACAHAIYAGRIARVVVEHSLFRDTREGHSIKSRAAVTEVTGCDIADGPDGTSSYLIEAPNGGALVVRGNTLEKGPRSGNHSAAIVIGLEGVNQPTPEITVEDNRFTNDGDDRTAFVWNVTATEAVLRGNTLSGAVQALRGDGTSRP